MRRRDFIALIGGLATMRVASARARSSTVPLVGFLNGGSPAKYAPMVAAFREGLRQFGYVDGGNIAIEFRWAEGKYDRLAAMATDLVNRGATVIAATSTPAAKAAKVITSTVPIVFTTGADPVQLGLVASLSRPGGNATGISFLVNELTLKQFDLLHQMVPQAASIGFLVNPVFASATVQTTRARNAARMLGCQLVVADAKTDIEIDGAFAKLVAQQAHALVTTSDPFLNSRRDQLIALAARHSLPTLYPGRDYVAAGGLMSYGTSFTEAYRQLGIYTGRILKGEKPADLPVMRPTKLELAINLKTAKALGVYVPGMLLAIADEVIE